MTVPKPATRTHQTSPVDRERVVIGSGASLGRTSKPRRLVGIGLRERACSHTEVIQAATKHERLVRSLPLLPSLVDPAQLPPVIRSASCSGQEIRRGQYAYPARLGLSCADLVVSGHRSDSDCSYGPLALELNESRTALSTPIGRHPPEGGWRKVT